MFIIPPSTESAAPVTKEASSESRKATARAISSGCPTRPIGCAGPRIFSITSALPWIGPKIGVSITPGQTAFTRILCGARSAAAHFIRPSTPCLVAQ